MTFQIETSRLRLRHWSIDDLVPLRDLFAKSEVWRFPFGHGFTAAETEDFLVRRIEEQTVRGWCEWATEERATGGLIGYIGLAEPTFLPEVMPSVEIGWRLDPAVWGNGFATEGARAALQFGFEDLELESIVSICEPENVASSRVMHRLGMQLERETVHPIRGVQLQVHRLTRADWMASNSSK